jgi:hypothetical protein
VPGLLEAVRHRLEGRPARAAQNPASALRDLIDAFKEKAGPQLREDMLAIKAAPFAVP